MKILTDPRSGSYQGITSSRNRYGQYVRTRATPVQPRTPRQGVIRGRFGTFATQWRGLTDAERSAWQSMAANYSVSDSLGQSNTLNGFSFYQSANLAAEAAFGETFGTTAPTVLADFVMDPGAYAIIADVSDQSVEVTFAPSPVPAGKNVIIQSTGPVSPGITSPPGPHHWRSIATLQNPTTTGADIATSYLAIFSPIVLTQKIFFRLAEYDENAGRRSAWATIQASIIA